MALRFSIRNIQDFERYLKAFQDFILYINASSVKIPFLNVWLRSNHIIRSKFGDLAPIAVLSVFFMFLVRAWKA
jgi:hypothetical protein